MQLTITPNDKLSEALKNVSLSWILKSFLPGNCRMMISTQMMEAPNTHAMPLSRVMIHPRSSLERAAVDTSILECRR